MAPIEFGTFVPCRGCHGAGKVPHRVTDEQRKARSREAARARRIGIDLDPVPSMDPCPMCAGKGYLPPKLADARPGPIQMYEGMD